MKMNRFCGLSLIPSLGVQSRQPRFTGADQVNRATLIEGSSGDELSSAPVLYFFDKVVP
jgi:hypothetical protein